jgi:hypothetical protein
MRLVRMGERVPAWILLSLLSLGSAHVQGGQPAATRPGDRPTTSAPAASHPATADPTRPASGPAAGSPTDSTAVPPPVEGAHAASGVVTEVIGLTVVGRRSRQRFTLDDMERIVHKNAYLLPLGRLARVLEARFTEQDGLYVLESAAGKFVLDIAKQELRDAGGQRRSILVVVSATELSNRPEVFISPNEIANVLAVTVAWNEEQYAYRIDVPRTLRVWQVKGIARQTAAAHELGLELPELHPPAGPEDSWLQMVEYSLKADREWRRRGTETSHRLSVHPPTETLWGRALGGAYKLRLSHPGYVRQDGDTEWTREYPDVRIDWGSWVYQGNRFELVLGDHVVGLTRLAFPRASLTGAKLTALSGFTDADLADVTTLNNVAGLYDRSHQFQGLARLGSRVDLFVNNRLVDTQEVVADKDTQPGMGRYRFEDVQMPVGSLVQARVVITEPEGTVRSLDQEFLDTRVLLPAGRAIYQAEAGSRRIRSNYLAENDPRERVSAGRLWGQAASAKLLYGLTDELTVGAAGATQKDLYREDAAILGDRSYATSSSHLGIPVYWSPSSRFLMSAEAGFSDGEGRGDDRYDGAAGILSWQLFPVTGLTLQGDLYHYGQNYFDGSDPILRNRRGWEVTGRWDIAKTVGVAAAVGGVEWVRQEEPADPDGLKYASLRAHTSILPRTSLEAQVDRMGTGQVNGLLKSISIRSGPWAGVEASLEERWGDDLAVIGRDLLDGLSLRGIPSYLTPSREIEVRSWLSSDHRVGARYTEEHGDKRRIWAYHASSFRVPYELAVENHLGRDIDTQSNLLSSRVNLYLDSERSHSVGMRVDYEDREWRVLAFVSLTDLIAFDRGRPAVLSRKRINPDSGGIHGRVFVDYNANGILDEGEEGLEGIGVLLDERRRTTTDKAGHYSFAAPWNAKNVRVTIDMTTVPAIYSVVHGAQGAGTQPGNLSRVDLAVTPVISASGKVETEGADKTIAIAGVRVRMVRGEDRKLISESITARDGSYLFSDLRPGSYVLAVDPSTLPPEFTIDQPEHSIKVSFSRDFQDFKGPTFHARRRPTTLPSQPATTAPAP